MVVEKATHLWKPGNHIFEHQGVEKKYKNRPLHAGSFSVLSGQDCTVR
jgi:hypothetical protein